MLKLSQYKFPSIYLRNIETMSHFALSLFMLLRPFDEREINDLNFWRVPRFESTLETIYSRGRSN